MTPHWTSDLPSTCHPSVVLSPVPVPVMKLALHDDGNLARLLLSSIHKILQSINDSIPNQVSTARNFPASASPGQNTSFVPSSSLAPPSSEVPQLASHARKDCGERKNQISRKPRKRKAQRPRRNEPQRCGGGGHICTNKNGETRKATASRMKIVWLSTIRLAC
jgi:hypothetical protein